MRRLFCLGHHVNKFITLRKNEDHRIINGHLWAFSNEIDPDASGETTPTEKPPAAAGEPQAGDIVGLRNHAGKFLGIGFYSPHSLIAFRLLTRTEEEIDFQFFRKRIESALALRKRLYPEAETFRLVHGESDFLPGLIIDKYNEHFSLQIFSAGMEKRLTLICDVLESLFHPAAIVERNDSQTRALEGLELRKGVLRGSPGTVTFSEYGIKYCVDLLEGQKTGFFLDQRENRKAIRRYARGGNVLDCFCNEGGFGLHAAYAEARNVTAVDISDQAIQRAYVNASLNNLKVNWVVKDAFEFLREAVNRNERYDLIILDPPSFAKNKKTIPTAKRGYKELHTLVFQLLPPGGILATASCSHHIYEQVFLDIINECAGDAGRNLSLLEWRGAAPDHPVIPAMQETRYLKFGIFRIE